MITTLLAIEGVAKLGAAVGAGLATLWLASPRLSAN